VRCFLLALLVTLALSACGSGDDGSSPTATPDSGIAGTVLAGPTCPVERPESPCPDQPLADAPVRIDLLSASASPVQTSSDSDGHFRVTLPPGTYKVTPLPFGTSGLPSPGQTAQVTVMPGQFAAVTLTYDTGIR
jgi:hypothetical protein